MNEPQNLASVSNEPSIVVIDGIEYAIMPLTIGDEAAAERYLDDLQMNRVLESTRNPTVEPEERAEAIARAGSRLSGLSDVLRSIRGQSRLLWSSMSRADRNVTWDSILKLTMTTRKILMQRLFEISGWATKEEDEENPMMAVRARTGRDGRMNLAGSADITDVNQVLSSP